MSIETIFAFASMTISVGALIVAWRKGASEARSLDADAADKYGDLAGKSADREARLMQRIEAMESQIEALDANMAKTRSELNIVYDWARRLSAQVIKLGGVPEEMVRR